MTKHLNMAPLGLLFRFALPLMLGNSFPQLCAVVDLCRVHARRTRRLPTL